MKQTLQLLALLFVFQLAVAKTYYISTTGNDSNSGTTPNLAFATFGKVTSKMLPGDTCLVVDGTYSQTFNISINTDGASTNWTVFKSINKWGAKIIIPASTGDYVYGFHTQTSKYIQIEGFEISVPSKNGSGIAVSGDKSSHHHIRAYNNHIYNCGAGGIAFQQGDYYDIQWNVIHHCAFTSQWQPSGITVYEARKSDSNPGFHIIVANNISYSNENKVPRDDGAFTDGNGIIIDDLNCSQQAPNIKYDQQTLVENNLCYDNGGRGVYVMSSQNVTFRNNTAYKNSRKLNGGDLVCFDASNITWINNIGYSIKGAGNYAISDDGAWGVNSNIKWINNISFNGTDGEPSVNINKTSTKEIDATNKLGMDPMFVNPVMDGTGDFRLKAASPAKDAGTIAFGIATTDIDSTARVQDGLVDMGCYETSGTTVAVTDITLNLSTASMAITGKLQLSSTLVPADASYRAITWVSSNGSVAKIDQNGLVTAISLGIASITVTSKDASKTAECEITVTNDASVNVTEISVLPSVLSLEVGTSQQINATVTPSYASNVVVWSTDNSNVASVSSTGLITAVMAGTANITATSEDGKKSASCVVTVKDVAVTGISLNIKTITIAAGTTKQLTDAILPANAKNKTVTWKSDNNDIATVSSGGMVKGISAGKATITVTSQDGNKTANCAVTVSASKVSEYEAEEGALDGGARIQNSGNASNGKVIGNINSEGSYVQISNVSSTAGGSVQLVISYANGYGDNRSLSLYVNDIRISQVVFTSTGDWNKFTDKTVSISLIAGTNNTIKLQRDAADVAAADIDKFTIIEPTLAIQSNSNSGQKFTIYPNPVSGEAFKLQFSRIDNNASKLVQIVDLQGKLMYSKSLKNKNEISINTVNLLGSGIYFITAQDGSSITNQKLIVKGK